MSAHISHLVTRLCHLRRLSAPRAISLAVIATLMSTSSAVCLLASVYAQAPVSSPAAQATSPVVQATSPAAQATKSAQRDPNAELEPAAAFNHLLAQSQALITARTSGAALELGFTYRQTSQISAKLLEWVKRGDQAAQIERALRAQVYQLFATPRMESWATKHINLISDELKSPFCPGKTLLTCTSPNAFTLRAEMRRELLQGYSDEEILSKLRDRFGQLENPPQPWYTIILPILPFIFGALIAVWVLSRWIGGGRARALSERSSAGDERDETEEVDSAHHDRLRSLLADDD